MKKIEDSKLNSPYTMNFNIRDYYANIDFLDRANKRESFRLHYYKLMNVLAQITGKEECYDCKYIPTHGEYCEECYFSLQKKLFNIRKKVFCVK